MRMPTQRNEPRPTPFRSVAPQRLACPESSRGSMRRDVQRRPGDVSGDALKSYKEIITCCKNEQIDRLVLHASDEGRSIYERLGFTESNERRFVDVS